MKLLYRRILYISFILIFFTLVPLLILYTSGYRYDFREGRMTRTGVLILESKPEKVNVYINDKLEFTKTPIEGKSLTPGLYKIKVVKKGYYPWEKELEIQSNLSTFAQDIILFKNTESIKIIDGSFADFTLSPDNEKIITLWQDESSAEIWQYDLKQQNSKLLSRNLLNNSKIKIKNWSAGGKNLLFNNQSEAENINNYFIIQPASFWSAIDKATIIYLNTLLKEPIVDIKWDDTNDNVLYANTKDSLYRVELNNKSVKKISTDKLSDFIIYDKILYFNTEISCLVEIDKNLSNPHDSAEDDCVYRLTQDNDYELIPSSRGLITLRSPSSKNLLVIDLNNKIKIFQAKADSVKWNTVSDKMLYYDDIEVSTFSPSHHDPYKDEVIGRYGQEIKNILWYSSHHHLVILFDNSVKIAELDARNQRNVIDLNSFSELKNIYLDEEGENIYVAGKRGEEEGIFQINIF
jgi:hypothetical protein